MSDFIISPAPGGKTGQSTRESLPVQPPSLPDYLYRREKNLLSEINCVMVGTIAAFYSATQTADVNLNFMRLVQNQPAGGGPNAPITDIPIPYPKLLGCPVVFATGGASSMTFPVAAGDSCVVLFNDRDLDAWWNGGQTTIPNSNRMHDLSDGIVIVGLFPAVKSLTSFNTSGPEIRNGTAKLSVEDKIKLIVGSQTLLDALDSLCTALAAAVISGTTFDATTIANINAAKTKIDAVLK